MRFGGRSYPWETLAIVLHLAGIVVWTAFSRSDLRLIEARRHFLHAVEEDQTGDFLSARRTFRFVAEAFPEAPEAEEASFRAALIALREIGDLAGARAAFRGYVERYPRGRFRQEAGERLDLLEAIPPGKEIFARLHLAAELLEDQGRFYEAVTFADRAAASDHPPLLRKTLELRSRIAQAAWAAGVNVPAREAERP